MINNAEAVAGLQQEPLPVVAEDSAADSHAQLCEKRLRRAGVRETPSPIAAYNPACLGLPWTYVLIFIVEGTGGLGSLIGQVRQRWTTNPVLVEGIVRLMMGLQQVVTCLVTPALNADGSQGPVHPRMTIWNAVAPFMTELTSKFLYLDIKEAEHLSYAQTRMMAVQGADFTATAAQRRVTTFALQDARRGGQGGQGGQGGGRGRGGHYHSQQNYRQQPLPLQPYHPYRGGGRGGRGGKRDF